MSNRRLWIAGGAGVILIILCASILIWKTNGQAQPLLTAAQIGDRVEGKYPGKVTSIVQDHDAYQVKLESETGVYEITMSAASGEIQSIRQLQGVLRAKTDQSTNGTASASGSTTSTASNDATTGTDSQTTNNPATGNAASGDDGTSNSTASTNQPDASSSGTSSAPSSWSDAAGSAAASPSPNGMPASSASGNTGSDASSTGTNTNHPPAPNGGPVPPDDTNSPTTNNKREPAQAGPGKRPSSSATSITEKQAEQIAIGQVKGEVDDVKFKHSGKTGQQYYLVEMDTPDDREAVVQINAISGAVMSVTWDDEEDSDKKDKDH
ncbi:PepSY domain-containing protein [Paenibacillus wenxiniae]|uniref:PepSY domain-containing protein n=1 Tax=Paenibacillus wenxiniae TaxID=1636843 RepID=A0ABW4RQM6_9BACL